MVQIRIVEIPAMKAAYSGPLTDKESFEGFVRWFSGYHAAQKHALFPRDFMWYNERKNVREWFYALPCEAERDTLGGYAVVDLPAGLFAVASCLDADLDQAADWLATRQEIMAWVKESDRFELYENGEGKAERYPMFQIVSPGALMPMGLSIEDLYVPIALKK